MGSLHSFLAVVLSPLCPVSQAWVRTLGHRVSWDRKGPALILLRTGVVGEARVATSEAEVLEKLGPRLGWGLPQPFIGAQVTLQHQEHSTLTRLELRTLRCCSNTPRSGAAPSPCFLLWKQPWVIAPLRTRQWHLKKPQSLSDY